MRRASRGAAAALAFALLPAAPAAFAQETPAPCRAEVERLCGDRSGADEVTACVRARHDELSATCRAAFDARERQRERKARFLEACAADMTAHCADVPEGALRVIACLMRHRSELSEACRDLLPSPD